MRIFHSGYDIIKKPNIHAGRKNADFGPGFYLSSEEDFAMRWVKCRDGEPSYVNIYELDTEGLSVKTLSRDVEWFDYISGNRKGSEDVFASYDVIVGPIANDTLYDVFGIPTSGMLSREDSLALLKLGGEYHQIVIKSELAAERLRWEEAVEVNSETVGQYRELIQAEKEAYQLQFQEYLENM